MGVPPLDMKSQHAPIRNELLQAIEGIVDSGAFVLGQAVADFEAAVAEYCKAKHAIGVSSGTDALIAALMTLDIGYGDEVICPPFTFFATVGSIWRVGAKPVFVDIDSISFNIDPAKIEAAITDKTKAIMPVHLYGQCADMDAICDIAKKHNLAIIEDAAQAIGSKDHDRPAGSIGTFGCLSFYPTKNLGGLGDGGMMLTNDDDLATKARFIRNHGQVDAYHHQYVGGNFRLDGIQAATLNVKLKYLDDYNQKRRERACLYHRKLKDTPLVLPKTVLNSEAHGQVSYHVFNQFTISVQNDQRDALSKHLSDRGIINRAYYPLSLHLQPCFASLGYKLGDFPESEKASQQVLSIPLFPEMTDTQQDEVVEAIKEFF